MKKLMYISTLAVVATLLMAPAAVAQESPYCPEGGFPASAPGDPGEGSLVCFDTQEEANIYSETGQVPGEEPPIAEGPTAPETQYETPATPPATETPTAPETSTSLPDTGGPALLLPAAGLLLATGLIGLKMVRRRS